MAEDAIQGTNLLINGISNHAYKHTLMAQLLGVQNLTQGHLNMLTGGAGDLLFQPARSQLYLQGGNLRQD